MTTDKLRQIESLETAHTKQLLGAWMRTSDVNLSEQVKDLRVTEDTLAVDLMDGRTISVPLAWFPRLLHGSPKERQNWRLSGGGEGIHWPDLDEDISVDGLLAGYPSGESQSSLKRWLDQRKSK